VGDCEALVMTERKRKYEIEHLIRAFRLFAAARKEALAAGFNDNAGAIHSCERILNILGLRLNYPNIGHINNLKRYEHARFSVNAEIAYANGGKVQIEHVAPLRAFTKAAIAKIDNKATDAELIAFIREKFELVLLTPEETLRLNKQNRSKMVCDRLGDAGIELATSH
jgi:hypothetical protein